jgi:CheY-like chemotaxis protein
MRRGHRRLAPGVRRTVVQSFPKIPVLRRLAPTVLLRKRPRVLRILFTSRSSLVDSRGLITIETSGEPREMTWKNRSGTFLLPAAHSRPPDRIGTMSDIVIYEENDLMRALLREWLSQAGYRVREAAAPGLRPAGTEDLVIVSVYMPKQAGAQLVREVQAAHPGTPVIAISAQFRSGLSAVGTTAQMSGVARVLAKPLTRGDLLEAVRAIIGASS